MDEILILVIECVDKIISSSQESQILNNWHELKSILIYNPDKGKIKQYLRTKNLHINPPYSNPETKTKEKLEFPIFQTNKNKKIYDGVRALKKEEDEDEFVMLNLLKNQSGSYLFLSSFISEIRT